MNNFLSNTDFQYFIIFFLSAKLTFFGNKARFDKFLYKFFLIQKDFAVIKIKYIFFIMM